MTPQPSIFGNILQIIPAQPAWEAVYSVRYKNKRENTSYYKTPLVGWALVQLPNNAGTFDTVMIGMVIPKKDAVVAGFADAIFGFLGYDYPGCDTNWHLEAERFRKNNNEN